MFNDDILIDRNNLEEECASAPAYFDYWQNQEADLKTDKENKEHNLAMAIRQMTDEEIKSKYGFTKVTEGAVTAIVKSDPEFQRLSRQYRQAEASRKSYEKKITLLDTLAKLHGQGYFSKIEGKPELRSIMAKDARKKIEEAIRERRSENEKNKPRKPRKA